VGGGSVCHIAKSVSEDVYKGLPVHFLVNRASSALNPALSVLIKVFVFTCSYMVFSTGSVLKF